MKIKINSVLIIMLTALLTYGCAQQGSSDIDQNYETKDGEKLTAKVIYGADGRLDLFQVSDERLKTFAQSTVALIDNNSISTQGSLSTIKASTYRSQNNLCSTERFGEQEAAAFCSGSLVGEDLIMTAGHCITKLSDCSSTSFVFDYALKQAGTQARQVASSDVYKCVSIVKRKFEESGTDYTLVKLDRKVSGRTPLKIRRSGSVQINDELAVIGHPAGLPTKVTVGGIVRGVSDSRFFVANTDTYGGNSGSAVFNVQTGLIEGILVRGETDFKPQGSCNISYKCSEMGCRGEAITRVSELAAFIPETNTEPEVPVDPPVKPEDQSISYASGASLNIPDNTANGITSLIPVDQIPSQREVSVSVNIQHTYIGDLIITLQTPSGKKVILHSRSGGSKKDIKTTYYVTSTVGSESKTGDYKLLVQDRAARDIGTLIDWKIEFIKK